VFSPDGKLIAFNGQYEGNVDVLRGAGGRRVPKRLTYHPGPDRVGRPLCRTARRCYSPAAARGFENRHTQLFTVPVGRRCGNAAADSQCLTAPLIRPTEDFIVYNPHRPAFQHGNTIVAAPSRNCGFITSPITR